VLEGIIREFCVWQLECDNAIQNAKQQEVSMQVCAASSVDIGSHD